MYVPLAQLPSSVSTFFFQQLPLAWLVKTRVKPSALQTRLAGELQAVSGGLPVTQVRSMDDVAARSIARTRFNMRLMTIFGLAAGLLAALGIYGFMSSLVKLQTKEFSIRMALGDTSWNVGMTVLARGARLAIAGLLVGVPASFVLARLLTSLLFGVTTHDPMVFASVPLLLVIVALTAVWIPARRAARLDPAVTLRCE
jgi:ABC-type antimicrobial peptide transport system permease subunit